MSYQVNMENRGYHIIPVQVLAVGDMGISVQVVNQVADCPQCAAGQGCGQNPWFRGIIGQKSLLLPVNLWSNTPVKFEYAELYLPNTVLTYLTLLLYGLPLFIFFLTLAIGQLLPVWLQFICAILAVLGSLFIGKFIASRMLMRSLLLYQITCDSSVGNKDNE